MAPLPLTWLDHAPSPPKLPHGKKWHVFISYRSLDRSWVIQLYDILTELGFEVFLDQFVLRVGDRLNRNLQKNLAVSMSGMIIHSNHYNDSEWTIKELENMEELMDQDPSFNFCILKLDKSNLDTSFISAKASIYADFSTSEWGPNGYELLRLLYFLNDNSPLSPEAVKFGVEFSVGHNSFVNKIQAAKEAGFTEKLIEILDSNDYILTSTPTLKAKVIEELIALACYKVALAFSDSLIESFPKAIRPKQLKALALARLGETKKAMFILQVLEKEGHLDPETLGILARAYFDEYKKEGKRISLEKSRNLYEEAFLLTPSNEYVGINAAAKSIFLGEKKKGEGIAQEVLNLFKTKEADNYWKIATLGEAYLILKDIEKAKEFYRKAVIAEPNSIGSHQSTLKQALLLADHLGFSEEQKGELKQKFDIN